MLNALVCDFVRTPIGRFGGSLSSVRTDDLGAIPISALLGRNPEIPPASIDEVYYGCANQAGEDNRNVARMSLLLAGLPASVPGITVNRLCASGMDAIVAGARAITAGEADLVIAGGVESMSRAPFVMPKAQTAFSRSAEIFDTTIGWRFVNREMQRQYGTDSMPETAENVAELYRVGRGDQDRFALGSQRKTAAARASGRLDKEIVPVEVKRRKQEPLVVSSDEHPRETTFEKLSSLPAPFRGGGTVTAGNASGVNDGAAAVLLASPGATEQFGLSPLARIAGAAAAGLEPRIMGMGPVPAIRKLCSRRKTPLEGFDVIEINEAFASQCLAVLGELGIDPADGRVNPNGGAIALGHPLGMSGARIVGTAALQLHICGGRRALASMCVGVGQGVAVAMEAA